MDDTWFQRVDLECRARNLTRGERDVIRALGRLMLMGDHAPSEARLASEAGVSKRTVSRAKARARALGLLAWDRRHAGAGLRRELPCAYRAEAPAGPVVRRERQKGAGQSLSTERRGIEAQIAALPPVTPGLLALWERRRLARIAVKHARDYRTG